jgi:hypothetical protein
MNTTLRGKNWYIKAFISINCWNRLSYFIIWNSCVQEKIFFHRYKQKMRSNAYLVGNVGYTLLNFTWNFRIYQIYGESKTLQYANSNKVIC